LFRKGQNFFNVKPLQEARRAGRESGIASKIRAARASLSDSFHKSF
jgi:hypothetical protein